MRPRQSAPIFYYKFPEKHIDIITLMCYLNENR